MEMTKGNKGAPEPTRRPPTVRYVNQTENVNNEFTVFHIHKAAPEPAIVVPMELNGAPVSRNWTLEQALALTLKEFGKKNFRKQNLFHHKLS